MAAYGGYVAAQPADLSGLISDFGTKAIAIKEAQKERAEKQELLKQQKAEKIAERDERRAYEEKQAEIKDIGKETDEALKRINKETTLSPSITLNEVYGKSTNAGSNLVYNLTKAMKEDPQNRGIYSGKIQNIVQQMEDIAQAKENLAKGTEELTKDIPNQSKQGAFLSNIYMGMGDLEGFDVKENPEEYKIQYFKKDAEGNEIPGTTFDPSVFKNYYKYRDPKEDFNKTINDFLNTIETRDVTVKSGPRTQTKITSIENNPAYEPSKEAWKKGFLADDARVARYLTDSGRYGMYYNELQNVPGSDNNKFIVYEMKDNGGVFPKVTPEMKKEAEAMLNDQFKAMIKESKFETRDADVIVNTGGGMETYLAKEDLKEKRKMEPLLNKARITNDFFYNNDLGPIKAAAITNGITKPTITDKTSYKILYGIPKGEKKIREIARFNNPREAHAYLTGKSNIVEAATEYDLADKYAVENAIDLKSSKTGLLNNVNVKKK